MALIFCPECNKKISDRAINCPNCGLPLSPINDTNIKETKYDLILIKYTGNNDFVAETIYNNCYCSLGEARRIIQSCPSAIMKNVSLSKLTAIQKELLQYRIITEIVQATDRPAISKKVNFKPKCPTCGSNNVNKISTMNRAVHGYAFGLFSKTARSQFECLDCGYKW